MIDVLEGLLFLVGDEGIKKSDAAEVLELDESKFDKVLDELKIEFQKETRGLEVTEYGEYIRFVTKKKNKKYFEKLTDITDDSILSQSCLETLAIVAYNQPVSRISVDEIRGIDSSYTMRKLVGKNLIKDIGRSDAPGRPKLYVVTKEFLDYFGLKSIDDLPKFEEIKIDEKEETDLYKSKYTESDLQEENNIV